MSPELAGFAPEAAPLPAEAPAPSIPRDAAEKVLGYLVFHRALLGEGSDASSAMLERYLGLVEKLREGVHVIIPDPVQKATALLFELVLEEQFDPWEIDLARFTEAYLERVRADGAVNFAVAGRLLYMAWSILYLQSEELLRERTAMTASTAVGPDGEAPPTDDGYLALLETPEAVDVTTAVLESAEAPPLLGMVRHNESRPVSLLELVKAFGEAEADARASLKVQQLRERLQEEQRAPPEVIVHGDIPERDLEDAWQEVARHPLGEAFPFLDLWPTSSGRDRLVAVFLAVLFLARERSVELRQDELGGSPILLVRTAEARHPVAEEA
jgi:segregation and condensation protein A